MPVAKPTLKDARQLVRNRLGGFQEKIPTKRATVGHSDGSTVDVEGKTDYIFVRIRGDDRAVWEVQNFKGPLVYNTPVIIKLVDAQKGIWAVDDVDRSFFSNVGGWGRSNLLAHAPSHEWADGVPGEDPLNVYQRALVPLRAYPFDGFGLEIFVAPGIIPDGTGGVTLYEGGSITITPADLPIAGQKRNALITLDMSTPSAPVVARTLGDPTVDNDSVTPSIPSLPAAHIPSALVLLKNGDTQLAEGRFRDYRKIVSGLDTGIWTRTGTDIAPTNSGDTVSIDEYLQHVGDLDTRLRFMDDLIEFEAGGVAMIRLTETTQDVLALGDVAGTGDVDVSINDGQVFVEGSSGKTGIGTETIPHGGVGAAMLALDGANISISGPHIQATTVTDNYPLLQYFHWSHDNIALNFDSYYDGAWRSSDVGSNAQIYKAGDLLKINWDTGIAQGSVLTWNDGLVLDLMTGRVGIAGQATNTLLEMFTTTAGDGLISGKVFSGNWNGGGDYASWSHASLRTTTSSYAILQHSDGSTNFNAGSGKFLIFGVNNTLAMAIDPDLNMGLGTTTQFGSGAGVFGIANAVTNPSTNPSGGYAVYSDTGALKGRGSSGTVTTIGNADPHCPVCGRDAVLEWQNDDQAWHLIVCVNCLSRELGDKPWIIRKEKLN